MRRNPADRPPAIKRVLRTASCNEETKIEETEMEMSKANLAAEVRREQGAIEVMISHPDAEDELSGFPQTIAKPDAAFGADADTDVSLPPVA